MEEYCNTIMVQYEYAQGIHVELGILPNRLYCTCTIYMLNNSLSEMYQVQSQPLQSELKITNLNLLFYTDGQHYDLLYLGKIYDDCITTNVGVVAQSPAAAVVPGVQLCDDCITNNVVVVAQSPASAVLPGVELQPPTTDLQLENKSAVITIYPSEQPPVTNSVSVI